MNSELNSLEEGRLLLIDKPYDWTSFDVIRKLRNLLKIKKIGHAGTLDPLATGLLLVCTGKFTKRINEYMAQEKEYTGIIVLGATTPTFDLESHPENFRECTHITQADVDAAVSRFTGAIEQVPPIFSAIKKDGKRAYELARKGHDVELKPRPIVIKSFEAELRDSRVSFKIICSTGTYIRSIANDLGAALGCGGYLSELTRTRIGEFFQKDASTIDSIAEMFAPAR